jgi:hypothetical protein
VLILYGKTANLLPTRDVRKLNGVIIGTSMRVLAGGSICMVAGAIQTFADFISQGETMNKIVLPMLLIAEQKRQIGLEGKIDVELVEASTTACDGSFCRTVSSDGWALEDLRANFGGPDGTLELVDDAGARHTVSLSKFRDDLGSKRFAIFVRFTPNEKLAFDGHAAWKEFMVNRGFDPNNIDAIIAKASKKD